MKLKIKSFGFRLWSYFILFTALIFIVLWLLQTVFLQSFYNQMIISNTKAAAQRMIENSSSEDINDLIDNLAHENSVLIFITDTKGSILYSSDEFNGMHKRNSTSSSAPPKGRKGGKNEKHSGGYRTLPDDYNDFLEMLGANGGEFTEHSTKDYYVCGSYIDYYGSDEKAVLYVGATLDAVGSSVTIISIQLVWVTILSIITGFVLSWFIAKRFSVPVDVLSEKAKRLGDKSYEKGFSKGFCMELDELSDTLDRTNDKLNEAHNFQMELLSNISHDLRTPLTMIKGYAEMIRDISWEDAQQCSEDVAVIIKEADRLTALVNEILEYSELKSDGKTIDLVKTDLSHIVEKTADSFETLYRPEGIVLERSIEDGIIVSGNGSRLERALYNLLDNGFRHTNESRKIKLTLSSDKDKAFISVTDYGTGIKAEEINNIWDRYYTSRMRTGKGVSGLGLAIVKQIADMHSGVCKVESEEGVGSTFTIELNRMK